MIRVQGSEPKGRREASRGHQDSIVGPSASRPVRSERALTPAAALRRVLDGRRPIGVRVQRLTDITLCAVDLDRLSGAPDALAGLVDRILTPDERRRWAALPVARRRREWLGGRIAVKRAVQAFTGGRSPPLDVTIEADPDGPTRGRPFVAPGRHPDRGRALPSIGITHSGRWALAAAAAGPVGIDVERIRPFSPALRRSAFNAVERARIDRGPPEPDAATALWWTGKEALLKAAGVGVHGHLHAIELTDWCADRFVWRWSDAPVPPASRGRIARHEALTGLIHDGYAAALVSSPASTI